jgi:hypothetical protein
MVEEAFSRSYIGKKLGLELSTNPNDETRNRALVDSTIVNLFGAQYDSDTQSDLRLHIKAKDPFGSVEGYFAFPKEGKLQGYTADEIHERLREQGIQLRDGIERIEVGKKIDLTEQVSFQDFINDMYFPNSENVPIERGASSGFYQWTSRQCRDDQERYFLLFIEGSQSFDDEDSLNDVIPRNEKERRPYINPSCIIN